MFLAPVVFIGIYIANSVIVAPTRTAAKEVVVADAAVAVFCLLLWYFVVGRIHDWRAAGNVRGQVPGWVLGFGISARAGSGPSPANVLVATATNIQVWTGQGDSARPMGTWSWSKIGTISAHGDRRSSWIEIPIVGNTVPFRISAVENRALASFRVRGRARVRLIDRLEELRAGPPSPTYRVI